jgi:hypothetical protein
MGGTGEHQYHVMQSCPAPFVLFRAELQPWGNGIFAMALSKPAKSALQRVSGHIHSFNVIRSSRYSNIKAVGYDRIPIVSALSHSGRPSGSATFGWWIVNGFLRRRVCP